MKEKLHRSLSIFRRWYRAWKEDPQRFLTGLAKSPIFSTVLGFVTFVLAVAGLFHLIETPDNKGFETFFSSLWFSIVTVATVGYGDITPTSILGRTLAMGVIFVGVGYTGVVTGAITSWLVERNQRKEMGLVPLKNLEGHFVVCGWKPNMPDLLVDILGLLGTDSKKLILINQTDYKTVQALRKNPALAYFRYYSGDDTNQEDLKKACAHRAAKVMILADDQPGKSPEEVDFQSVLSSLAINRINPQAYQIVELTLPKFKLYLTRAKVEEIVLNKVYSRMLLCNIALMSGMYNVFKALFSFESGIFAVRAIAPEWVGKTYAELRSAVGDAVVVGLLENVGNLNRRKAEKMTQIQKSPSIQQAIGSLIELKGMQSNDPFFNPPPDYVIRENTDLMVLEKAPGEMNRLEQSSNTPGSKKVQAHKRLLEATLHENLALCETWEEYFENFSQQGVGILVEKDAVTGLLYLDEPYPFSDLEIKAELVGLIAYWYGKLKNLDKTKENKKLNAQANPKEYMASHPLEKPLFQEDGRKGQLLILGWKKEIIEMLHVLVSRESEEFVRWQGITLVADVSDKEKAEFEAHFGKRKGVRLVVGDTNNREVLISAGVMNTKKALVLAETGRQKSFQEMDAQSVLCCMMVNDLNKKVYIAAEILDRKYLETLTVANVEEIFLVDEFSNIMLANGSNGRGVSNVIRDVVNLKDNTIEILGIEARFMGLQFGELVNEYQGPGKMVLGLLEEAGNMYVRKSERIHQAQVLPNIKESVAELVRVKRLSANHVVFAPGMDYTIKAHSRLILLNTSRPDLWSKPAEPKV